MIFGFGPGHSSSSRIGRNRLRRWGRVRFTLKVLVLVGLMVAGYLQGYNPFTGERLDSPAVAGSQ